MIRRPIHQEDISTIKIYKLNIIATKYMKQTLIKLKGEIDNNTIILVDFNTPLSIMDRTFRQRSIRKQILNNAIGQIM